MNPFEHLGIEPSDDEREIKRAYARRLRQVRPDDDPAGFQALHEAYQHCLGYARHLHWQAFEQDEAQADSQTDDWIETQAETSADESVETLMQTNDAQARNVGDHEHHHSANAAHTAQAGDERHRPEPAAAAHQPAPGDDATPTPQASPDFEFDFDAFMSELLQRAAYQSSDGLRRWLRESEPLYSLDLKLALRAPVSQVLAQIERPLPVEATQAIFEFFSLDVVDPHDARLHEHALQARERAESSQRFEHTLEALQSQRVKPVDRLLTRELVAPWHGGRRLFIALVPLLPTRLMHALRALQGIDPQQAQVQLNAGSAAFWQAATDFSRLSAQRLVIAGLRIVVYYTALLALFSALIPSLTPFPPRELAIASAAWLGWACAQAAYLRWSPHPLLLRLDRRSVFSTLALIGAACLAPSDPFVASGLGIVVIVTVGAEFSPTHGSLAQYATYAMCAALVVCLILATGSWALTIPYALIGTGAIHIAYSFAVAWRRGINVAEARQRAGGYGYLIALSALAIAYGLYKMANG